MLCGEPIWHTSSTGPTSIPSSSEAVATSARSSSGPQPVLDSLAAFARERPVVRGHQLLAEPLAELMGHPLGQLARVDEHERRPVLGHVAGDSVEDVVELVARDRRLELAVGQLERDARGVAGARCRRSSGSGSPAPTSRRAATSSGRTVADRPIRTGGCSATAWRRSSVSGQMRPPFVAGECVNLIDDDRLHGGERGPGALGGQVQVQRLRSGDEQVRGPADHRLALRRAGVSGPHGNGDRRWLIAELPRHLRDLARAAPRGSCGCRPPAP